jgi:hypothetical protein
MLYFSFLRLPVVYSVLMRTIIGQWMARLKVCNKFCIFNFCNLVSPANFLQLFTVTALIDQSAVPSAFVLMQRKTKQSYTQVFEVCFSVVNFTICV